MIAANRLQVKAIAHAHVKTDKIDAGVLASLRAAGFCFYWVGQVCFTDNMILWRVRYRLKLAYDLMPQHKRHAESARLAR